jgi:exodeoxyribonuclease V alpha subunit
MLRVVMADIDTMHAMTIHKSQGSPDGEATVPLPQKDSRPFTRELPDTAATRAGLSRCLQD